MEFFNKIKTKLKAKNLLWSLFFLVMGCGSGILGVSNGFSSDMEWQIGVRGSRGGIPIPNWLISGFLVFMCALFIVFFFVFLKSVIKNAEFNKMLRSVEEIGDAESVGAMLAAMPKNKLAKGGDLRFNERILFYMKGTDATVIAPANIRGIRTEIVGNKGSETNYVCVYHGSGVLKITVSAKTVLPLLEEMRRMYAAQQ